MGSVDKGRAAAGDDTLLDGCTGRGDSVLDAVLLLVELDLCGRTHTNDAHTTSELGDTLLEFLAVPLGVRVVVLSTQLDDATLDVGLITGAVNDGGVVLGNDNLLGTAQNLEAHLVELEPNLGSDDLTTGESGDVLQHCLAAVTERRSLDCHRAEGTADLIDDEGAQSLPVNVLGHDKQAAVGGNNLLQQGEQVVHRRDLAGVNEDVRILDHSLHAILVGDHVRRQVTLVELHALGEVKLSAEGLRLVDGDNPVLTNLVEGLSDEGADGLVTAGDGGNAGHVRGGVDGARDRAELLHNGVDSLLDTALEADRVCPRGHSAQPLVDESLG